MTSPLRFLAITALLASTVASNARADGVARFAADFVGPPTGGGEPLIHVEGDLTLVSYPEPERGRFWKSDGQSWDEVRGAGFGGDTDMVALPDGRLVLVEMIDDRANGTSWKMLITVIRDGLQETAFTVSETPWWDRPWLVHHPDEGVLLFATNPSGTYFWRVNIQHGIAEGPYSTPSSEEFAGRPTVAPNGAIGFASGNSFHISTDGGRTWMSEEIPVGAASVLRSPFRAGLFPVVAVDGTGAWHWVGAGGDGVYWSTRFQQGTWGTALRVNSDGSPGALPWAVGNADRGVTIAYLEGRDTLLPVNPESGYLGTPTTVWDVVALRIGAGPTERAVVYPHAHRGTICAEGAPGTLGGGCPPAYALIGSPYHLQDRRLLDFITLDRDPDGYVSVAFTYVGPAAWTGANQSQIVVSRQFAGSPMAR
jgi:hypothetical protein